MECPKLSRSNQKIAKYAIIVLLLPYVYFNIQILIHSEWGLGGQRDAELSLYYRELLNAKIKERLEKVEEVCQEHGKEIELRNTGKFGQLQYPFGKMVWDRKHNVTYCSIAKIASGTWYTIFQQLGQREQGLQETSEWVRRNMTRLMYPVPEGNQDELFELWDSSTSFMVVRNPFERIISAYEDKMLKPKARLWVKLHDTMQTEIIASRKNPENFQLPQDLIETKTYQNLLTTKQLKPEDLKIQPSFPEVVDWLIGAYEERGHNALKWQEVWGFAPMYSSCPVCNIDFKVILKLDSDIEIDEIQQFIVDNKMEIDSNKHTIHNIEGVKSSSSIKAGLYYKYLTKSQVEKLAELYMYDLELFGYDYKPYYDLAQDDLNMP